MTYEDKGTKGVDDDEAELPVSLSSNAINIAINAACNKSWSTPTDVALLSQIRWKRHHCEQYHGQQDHPSLLYSIIGEIEQNGVEEHRGSTTVIKAFFYFAYSTWDGRILYVDNIHINDTNTVTKSSVTPATTETQQQQLISTVYHILANIAITLHCGRLTWQHTKDHTIEFPNIGTIQPETLHGWLTLHWEKESIIQFLGGQRTATAIHRAPSFRKSIETALQRCNAASAQVTIGPSTTRSRRLRLASPNDVHTIGRLVQGLADFEKEPDAVHVTPDHYHVDGFQSDPPLFYCILLETTTTTNEQNIETNDETNDWYACGMAFCWIGSRQDMAQMNQADSSLLIPKEPASLFLYLEDLFIEESYRGNGAGTFVMTTLGEIALSLKCNKMVWQALDWNTPALTFYQNKIGAHIVDGLLTTRFAGSTLHEFNAL